MNTENKMMVQQQQKVTILSESTIKVYPNPSEGNFEIRCENALIEEAYIRNLEGRIIKEFKNVKNNSLEISLIENSGVYLIEIHDSEGQIHNEKIIIK